MTRPPLPVWVAEQVEKSEGKDHREAALAPAPGRGYARSARNLRRLVAVRGALCATTTTVVGTSGGEESLAELLRPGKARSNTSVDHVAVLDAARSRRSQPHCGPVTPAGRSPCWCRQGVRRPPRRCGVELSARASLGHLGIHTPLAPIPTRA